jgi:quinol monooxygenase YgiN
MITRIVKVKIKADNNDKFIKYIGQFVQKVRNFKNNHHADCFADLDDKNYFHVYTIWLSENDLNTFRKSELNKEFKNKIKEWSEKSYSAWTVENI